MQERTILQFGKVAKDAFTLDYCYPMTALQVGGATGGTWFGGWQGGRGGVPVGMS